MTAIKDIISRVIGAYIKAFNRVIETLRIRRKVRSINKALGIKLMPYQIDYIFYDIEIPQSIELARRTGTTTARAIKLCLSEGETIRLLPIYSARARTAGMSLKQIEEYFEISLIVGSDMKTLNRYYFFVYETLRISALLSEKTPLLHLRDIRK